MKRVVLLILLVVFCSLEVMPAFAQEGDRILVAQQERRRTLFDLLFGEEKQATPQPPPVNVPAGAVDKDYDSSPLNG